MGESVRRFRAGALQQLYVGRRSSVLLLHDALRGCQEMTQNKFVVKPIDEAPTGTCTE